MVLSSHCESAKEVRHNLADGRLSDTKRKQVARRKRMFVVRRLFRDDSNGEVCDRALTKEQSQMLIVSLDVDRVLGFNLFSSIDSGLSHAVTL